jgi:Eukaryotic aspartyl protease
MGSQNDSFEVMIDSGSSDLWVVAEDCRDPGCTNRVGLGKSNSKSLTTTDIPFLRGYLGGAYARGVVASDKVTIAGLTLEKLSFGLASKVYDTVTQNVLFQASSKHNTWTEYWELASAPLKRQVGRGS